MNEDETKLERIAQMLESKDKEMKDLGWIIFDQVEPTDEEQFRISQLRGDPILF